MDIQYIEISKQRKRDRKLQKYLIELSNLARDSHLNKDLSESQIRYTLFQIQCSLEHQSDCIERNYLCVDKDLNQGGSGE
jgi:hypothetical protein